MYNRFDSRYEPLPRLVTLDNSLFKLAKSLGTRKGREKKGKFMVEGLKLVSEALRTRSC